MSKIWKVVACDKELEKELNQLSQCGYEIYDIFIQNGAIVIIAYKQ